MRRGEPRALRRVGSTLRTRHMGLAAAHPRGPAVTVTSAPGHARAILTGPPRHRGGLNLMGASGGPWRCAVTTPSGAAEAVG